MPTDFVVISRRTDGTLAASIVDPHGDHLADARNKLNALADYAELYGENFVRIDSITKHADELRYLDLGDEETRENVRGFEGAEVKALYVGDVSRPF